MDIEDDPVKLKAEYRRLLKDLKQLVVEKNLMEHKLYRAFHKLLLTKKRKIRQLEREVKKLKRGEDDMITSSNDADMEETEHCETCQCYSPRKGKSSKHAKAEEVTSSGNINDQISEDGDETQDPFASDDDETDIDDEPSSKSSSKTTSPTKTVIVSCHEPSGEVADQMPSTSKTGSTPKSKSTEEANPTVEHSKKMKDASKSTNESTVNVKKKEEPKSVVLPNSQSSEDMDVLVDELCS